MRSEIGSYGYVVSLLQYNRLNKKKVVNSEMCIHSRVFKAVFVLIVSYRGVTEAIHPLGFSSGRAGIVA